MCPGPAEALAEDVRKLHEVSARLVGLDFLVHGKSIPRDDPMTRRKDRADFERLSTSS